MNETRLAAVCAELARMMIIYGAEIYRVEDTVTRICSAYGHDEAEVYATPANFMITLKDKNNTPITENKVIRGRDTNLDRLGRINELSRRICAKKPPVDLIEKKLEEIKERPAYSAFTIYVSFAVVGAAFTVFFGGSMVEAAYAAILALIVRFIEGRLRMVRASTFLNAVVCSMVISVLAVMISGVGLVPRFDKMIIGASMCLVPGVAMTNCMRDFISGDFYSGIYTMTEALLTAAGLAVGAGSAVAAVIKF